MKEFCIHTINQPGALAAICETLARAAINIEAIATERVGDHKGVVHIVTGDEASTERILRSAHLQFEVRDILSVRLPDRPGEMAKISRRLANAGINIDSVYILGKEDGQTTLAMALDNLTEGRRLLKGLI